MLHTLDQHDKTTITTFEPRKYLGDWYRIASIPTEFEQGCTGAIAHYCQNVDGSINVLNICYNQERVISEIKGKVTIPNKTDPGKLLVEFNIPTNIPYINEEQSNQSSNYWIHATDYHNYSLVGSPDKRFLWILGRDRVMKRCLYDQLVLLADDLGYDTRQLYQSSMIDLY